MVLSRRHGVENNRLLSLTNRSLLMDRITELLTTPNAPVDLDELRSAIDEARSIKIVAGGKTFRIRPLELLSDQEMRTFRDTDDEEVSARLIVDDWDGFVAAGGNWVLLGQILEARAYGEGAGVGESGASSAS